MLDGKTQGPAICPLGLIDADNIAKLHDEDKSAILRFIRSVDHDTCLTRFVVGIIP